MERHLSEINGSSSKPSDETRQQLGYVVGADNLPLNRHPDLIFYIQSPLVEPQHLLDAVEKFIDLLPLAMLEFSE